MGGSAVEEGPTEVPRCRGCRVETGKSLKILNRNKRKRGPRHTDTTAPRVISPPAALWRVGYGRTSGGPSSGLVGVGPGLVGGRAELGLPRPGAVHKPTAMAGRRAVNRETVLPYRLVLHCRRAAAGR